MGPLSVCDTLPQTFTKQIGTNLFLVLQPVICNGAGRAEIPGSRYIALNSFAFDAIYRKKGSAY